MITEDYVSFEVAKLLKEKKFDEPCFTYYDNDDTFLNRFDKGLHFNNTSFPFGVPYNINSAKKYVVAPTLQTACKWLREIHNLLISINFSYVSNSYTYLIKYITKHEMVYSDIAESYEEAVEAGIKYTLENLI